MQSLVLEACFRSMCCSATEQDRNGPDPWSTSVARPRGLLSRDAVHVRWSFLFALDDCRCIRSVIERSACRCGQPGGTVELVEDDPLLVHHRRLAPADVVVALHLRPSQLGRLEDRKNHEILVMMIFKAEQSKSRMSGYLFDSAVHITRDHCKIPRISF